MFLAGFLFLFLFSLMVLCGAHTRVCLCTPCVFDTGSHCVAQAVLTLMNLSDSPTSASLVLSSTQACPAAPGLGRYTLFCPVGCSEEAFRDRRRRDVHLRPRVPIPPCSVSSYFSHRSLTHIELAAHFSS